MAKYKFKYSPVPVWKDKDLTTELGKFRSSPILDSHIVTNAKVVGGPKTVRYNGYTYTSATIIQFTINVRFIGSEGYGSSNVNVPVTGYSILSYRTTNGSPMYWFEKIEDEPSDNNVTNESSGTGTADVLRAVANDTTTPLPLEYETLDENYFDKSLTMNGIIPENEAEMLKARLNRLGGSSNVSMRLFGMPYQFMPSVDARLPNVSSRVGMQFMKNIISEAAILTITPGKPKYMGNIKGDTQYKTAWLVGATQSLNNIATTQRNPEMQIKYYDFEEDYITYMLYVNMMCRTAAGFMGIDSVPVDSEINVPLARFDWKQYRFDGIGYDTVSGTLAKSIGEAVANAAETVGKGVVTFCSKLCESLPNNSVGDSLVYAWKNTTGEYNEQYPNSPASVGTTNVSLEPSGSEEDRSFLENAFNLLGINENFVQFMIEPASFSESSDNETMTSSVASSINDQLGNSIKEIRFIAGSAGAQGLTDMTENASQAILQTLSSMGGNMATNVVARVAGATGQLLSGDRIIFPEIFDKNNYRKSYNVTVKLKSPYGDRYSYYINILVPLFHLIALAAPKQTSGNTYDSPFLIRAFLPGMWQCNMGIVKQLQIERNGSDGLSIDGYPLELTVTLQIDDLYSDLMITPTTNPQLFMCNTGLVDFIMIQCGLDVTNRNYTAKLNNALINITNKYTDVYRNVTDSVNQVISHELVNFAAGILH